MAIFVKSIYAEQDTGEYQDAIEIITQGPRSSKLIVPGTSEDFYTVKLNWTATDVKGSCDCRAYEDYGPCKHLVAATHHLLEYSAVQEAEVLETMFPKKVTPPPPSLAEKKEVHCKPQFFFAHVNTRNTYYWEVPRKELKKITPSRQNPQELQWEFTYQDTPKNSFQCRIAYDAKETFRLFCSCAHPGLCKHIEAAAFGLYDDEGRNYFVQFRDFSAEKAAIWESLGLKSTDPEAAEIHFFLNPQSGTLEYKAPAWLWSGTGLSKTLQQAGEQLGLQPLTFQTSSEDAALAEPFVPAVAFQLQTGQLPFPFELVLINTAGKKFSKWSLNTPANWPPLKDALPQSVWEPLERLSQKGLNKFIGKDSYHLQLPGGIRNMQQFHPEALKALQNRYRASIADLWPWLTSLGEAVYVVEEGKVSRNNCVPVTLHREPVTAGIQVVPAGRFIELRLSFTEVQTGLPVEESLQSAGGILLRGKKEWYLPADEKTGNLMQTFPAGYVKIVATALDQVLTEVVPLLRQDYPVTLDETLQPTQVHRKPMVAVHLSEQGDKNLLLQPRFRYGEKVYGYEEAPRPILQKAANGKWEEILRDADAEKAFAESLRELHPSFAGGQTVKAFSISFPDALQDSWYQKTLALLEEREIPVTGIDDLRHFRYNSNEARVSVSSNEAGSGIDWFDLSIEISFGEQQVSLKEVRRALMNGQAGVKLEDGTIGLLPSDFVAQYGAMLKLGSDTKEGGLRLSKLHFTLIDELHEAVLSRDLSAEIAAKKEALRNIENLRPEAVPAGIQATLRPYQVGGYQWLQALEELGWGGCLADDMGLGKTLQTITFLQHLKGKYPESTHLVICPTSLIYNWQSELEKFAPDLRFHVHYGPDRKWEDAMLTENDIIITTYGIIRSDLKKAKAANWHYIILDESQAIKNPEAQTTKAVQMLPARNRICLSGTPLQNNTYDLYAQFQFLNPGLLGNRDFFRTQFANPIDKNGEENARTTLRKMLQPFMLRRTKQQVATDLPDKTEMILWCEMESEQRAVYDEYKRYYRDKLLQRIDSDGMAGSAIYVLEALLRLRQLCDHPALVKNEAVKTSESVKLSELRREIEEDAGGKKVLVFSQFTEMLHLIAKDFTEAGIKYAYLDGSTPAAARRQAVEDFQTDESVRVFLISLKAGGVGLNLTAAEYVFLVDPWWNPAVEAQAIDRTHRIGQTAKIMAYRMICKDTVEEKVMQLQSRKRALADGLVTEDAGFVKKLTRDDVAFLLE